MLTIGAATISFSLCVLLIDFFPPEAVITKVSRKLTTPFLWLGSNPLAIYVLMMELVALLEDNFEWDGINLETRIMNFLFDSWIGNTKLSSLLFSLLFVLLWTGVALVLYRKQIFIKL
jgi:predicted acyltransferase